jgi:hypothetical protein
MGFRFRKRIKLAPGVHINLSRRGVSTSLGAPGATVNVSKRGTRATVGLPGTGLSYTEQVSRPRNTPPNADDADAGHGPGGRGGSDARRLGLLAILAWLGVGLVLLIVLRLFTSLFGN